MAESVPVRCPACRREHCFTPSTFPCACGAPLTLPVQRGAQPEPLRHHTWDEAWVTVRCPSCARKDQWPQPELGCPCGTIIRLPVAQLPEEPLPRTTASGVSSTGLGGHGTTTQAQSSAVLRPAFRPVTIRTSRDAVTAAAQYLKWLGFTNVLRAEEPAPSGVDLRGPGIVAQVDPTTRPSTVRDVECLWLNGLNSSAESVFFSLAGYSRQARLRADDLHIPLFVMDLTGTPQPVNDAADDLIRMGAQGTP
ncbi:hypothetical protein ABZW18_09625 [Streptomyces sp. NPDC004647]|uniref:hypothetical protein n=1 Tax=Streptomyces sp. NPDC004647 TaxID=3154671 RepID=UPI0033A2E5DF